jgi:hypothetical protein
MRVVTSTSHRVTVSARHPLSRRWRSGLPDGAIGPLVFNPARTFTLGLGILPTRAWPASAGWRQPGPPGLARLRELVMHPEGSPKRKRGECGLQPQHATA